ncbi:MAG: beta-ketoacyl synthase N-terminal-like domain-containing protein [Desulfurivibrionaceae bacterium]
MSMPVAVSAIARLPKDYRVPDELARDLRRADAFIQMAVISAFTAVSELPSGRLDPEEVGVFIGTAFGPLETNFESLGSLIDDGEGQISPTLFSHSVYNAAAGYVARLLDIRGPAVTITNYGWPFLVALEEGRLAVASGRIGRAVVIGVETYSDLLADAYRRFFGVTEAPWQRGAVAWVLEPAEAAKGYCRLAGIKIREFNAEPADLLTRRDETLSGPGIDPELPRQPMAYVEALSDLAASFGDLAEEEITLSLEAPFGAAEIGLCR